MFLVNVILWNVKLFSYVQVDLPIQDMEPKIFSTDRKENVEVFKSLKELTKLNFFLTEGNHLYIT